MNVSSRPRVFIASPLFNPVQIGLIQRIEDSLSAAGYDFYSARLHSGSERLTPEQRKSYDSWTPVYLSNERGLDSCRVQICVLEYAMPYGHSLAITLADTEGTVVPLKKHLELPDAGTVWEAGYMRAQGKLVIGFHSTKRAEHLNLMLSHGTDGLITGFDALESFLAGYAPTVRNTSVPERVHSRALAMRQSNREAGFQLEKDAVLFNWDACQTWNREVE